MGKKQAQPQSSALLGKQIEYGSFLPGGHWAGLLVLFLFQVTEARSITHEAPDET